MIYLLLVLVILLLLFYSIYLNYIVKKFFSKHGFILVKSEDVLFAKDNPFSKPIIPLMLISPLTVGYNKKAVIKNSTGSYQVWIQLQISSITYIVKKIKTYPTFDQLKPEG